MLNKLLELIFPPKCIFCRQIIHRVNLHHICSKCYNNVNFFEGTSIFSTSNIIQNQFFDDMVCVFEYEGIVKESIKQFKFYQKPSYSRTFAALLSERLMFSKKHVSWDIIVGVPLHKSRLHERGFNQSQLLAKELSHLLQIPENSDILKKIKMTKVQSLLNRRQRFENLKDAFQVVKAEKICGKKILLIDDILTTGVTANECAKVLKHAGATQVTVGVIASRKKL